MKEIIPCIALLLSFSLWTERQSNDAKGASTPRPLSFERDDECGIPLRESMLWLSVEGKVIKVVDGDTIILLTKDNRRKRVNLVAVDASAGQDAARSLLSRLAMNRSVSVLVNPNQIKSEKIVGVVRSQERDVNRELLEAGVVRYHEPKSYNMSRYTACVYRIVEREAREAKRGLWLNASR